MHIQYHMAENRIEHFKTYALPFNRWLVTERLLNRWGGYPEGGYPNTPMNTISVKLGKITKQIKPLRIARWSWSSPLKPESEIAKRRHGLSSLRNFIAIGLHFKYCSTRLACQSAPTKRAMSSSVWVTQALPPSKERNRCWNSSLSGWSFGITFRLSVGVGLSSEM